MSVVAKWGKHTFKISTSEVTPIYGFTSSYSMKENSNTDTSGKKKTNTRGRAPEEPSFSVQYTAAVGAKPRTDFTSWRKEVGKKNYLYIGTGRYGVNKFELKSAEVSDVILDNKGRTTQATVTLHFLEIMPKKKKKNKKGSKQGAKAAKPSKDDAKKRKKNYVKRG